MVVTSSKKSHNIYCRWISEDEKKEKFCTIRDANSRSKRCVLTAINTMFMYQEQRREVKKSVRNEQPVLTKYLQDSGSQLPQPFNRLSYSNPAKTFLAASP